ncbi:MAG: hypothetical protein OEN01_01215 [Candidatus Krumholzibacteria bacterium]|nr:hypothetical protein [Candidatus Krumholzibacteria bacterium]
MNKTRSFSIVGLGLLAMVLTLAWSPMVYGQSFPDGTTVKETLHNLRRSAVGPMPVEDYGEICVYCHTPHNSNTAVAAPLWNRTAPAGPYTMYSSPTLDMTIDPSPGGVTLACLSCHDGTIGVDVIINEPFSYSGSGAKAGTIGACAGCHDGDSPPGGLNFEGTLIGTDLSNDHPVSIQYDPTADSKFHPAADVVSAGLPLYVANRVECGSCHDPHSAQWRPFLRMSNDDSAMCLTCHNI